MRVKLLRASNIVLGLLCLMYFLTYLDRVNISTAMASNEFLKEIPLTKTQTGLIFSAFAYPYLLFQIGGGWVADKFGPRLALALCGIIWASATIMTGLVHGLTMMFIARVILGFGEGATFPTATRAMSSWMPSSKRGYAQGITHACARVGSAMAPPLMIALFAVTTWRGSFVAVGAVSLVWLAIWAWYFRDDPRTHPSTTEADLESLPRPVTGGRPKVPWFRLARTIYPVTIVDFCYGWTVWLFLSWIPTFFVENYHVKLADSAFYSAGVLSAGLVGDTVGGLLTDRILRQTGSLLRARRSVIVGGFLGAFVFMIPVVLIHDLTTSALFLSLAFFFAELVVAPIWSVPMDIAPRFAGTASGMMNFGFAIAGLISPSSFGYLVDLTGSWIVPFIGSTTLLLVGAILALRLRPDRQFAEAGA